MCGRFTQTKSRKEALDQLAEIELPPLFQQRYNIAPTQKVAVIRQQSPNQIDECIWGFKNPRSGAAIINARSETLTERPMFKNLIFTHRCLIPADGFYEWKDRQPYYFQTQNQRLFAFAGFLHENRCVILTRAADSNMQGIHDRMPVILPSSQWKQWLLVPEAEKPRNSIVRLQLPEPPEPLSMRPVSRRVNKVGFDSPACLEPGEVQTSLFPDEL